MITSQVSYYAWNMHNLQTIETYIYIYLYKVFISLKKLIISRIFQKPVTIQEQFKEFKEFKNCWPPWLMFRSKFSFTIFLFFPLFSKVSTNILKIYELPKINNTIPKYYQTLVLTIIIYLANSMSQLHLASELYPYQLYWKCVFRSKGLFWH